MAGWQIEGSQIRRVVPAGFDDLPGLVMVVRDEKAPPEKAKRLKQALASAKIFLPIIADPTLCRPTARCCGSASAPVPPPRNRMSVATLTEAVARPPAAATTRVAAFDGMRGVACLLVMVSHYFGHGYSFSRLVEGGGTVGVMMFFVLSGYLIGGILIDHHDSPSYFRTFYVRRAFRIFPIYYVVIGLSPLAMAVCTWTPQYFSLWSYLTYTVNFSMAFSGEYGNALMVPVWSLCIEEQFYLLFPLLLYALPRHWRLERVLLVLIVLAVVCRGVLAGAGANELYGKMLLPTRMDALALGVLAAHVRRTRRCVTGCRRIIQFA